MAKRKIRDVSQEKPVAECETGVRFVAAPQAGGMGKEAANRYPYLAGWHLSESGIAATSFSA